MTSGLPGTQPLAPRHDTSGFDCGRPELTLWLRDHGLEAQIARTARVFVAVRGKKVVAFYALAAASADRRELPAILRKGTPRHPVPLILIARLGVDLHEQGKGLGESLLRDALLRCASAAGVIGAPGVVVHALDDEARGFYEHFGFERSPIEPLHLSLPLESVIESARVAAGREG